MKLLFCNQCHKEIILNWIICRYCNSDNLKILNCIECFSKIHTSVCQEDDGWMFFYRYRIEYLKEIIKRFSTDSLKFSKIIKNKELKDSAIIEELIDNNFDKGKSILLIKHFVRER